MPEIRPAGASSRINMLLHTDPGWGKTSFIGTGGNDFKILLMRSPIDHADPIVGSGVQEMVVKNWEDTFEGLDYMRHNGQDWDWFCIDSISLLQDVGLDDIYEGILDKKGPPGSEARKARQQFGPDKGEYGVNMWRLAQFVRHAVGEGSFNLLITAHSFYHEDEAGDSYLAPWIQGKGMVSRICGMMNIIGYGNLVEREVRGNKRVNRVVHWNKHEDYYAKNQFKLPDGTSVFPTGETIEPNMPAVVEAIMKGRAKTPGRRRPAAKPAATSTRKPGGRPSARRS